MPAADPQSPPLPQWPELRSRILRRAKRRSLTSLWPEVSRGGEVLCWGLETCRGELAPLTAALSRCAAGKWPTTDVDLVQEAEWFTDGTGNATAQNDQLIDALLWAYAMPTLAAATDKRFPEALWWQLLETLQSIHQSALDIAPSSSPAALLAGAELGLVLAWQLEDLPSCAALKKPSLKVFQEWLTESGHSVAAAVVDGGKWLRPVLASGLRTRRLAARFRQRIGTRKSAPLFDMATWAAALARPNGSQMLGPIEPPKADTGKRGFLLQAAEELGGESLQTAMQTSLHRLKSDGRLAWRMELPEPGWFDEDAKLAVMLPEWDVRRGRLAVDFSGRDLRVELASGSHPILQGLWTANLRYGGTTVEPTEDWRDLCWYSDDDVHYLELEQSFDGDLRLQRQILLLRDDRCLMVADAVLGAAPDTRVELESRLELAPLVTVEEDAETRELVLADAKPRALLVPLALNEWRVGPTPGVCELEEGSQGFLLTSKIAGQGNLYQPLWLDLQRKRIRKPMTWRRLTVAQQRRLVEPHEAAAFRIHVGNEQWVIYRSLTGAANRTFLGKNLISDFYCGRFDSDDGSLEELVSVDEQPD